MIKTLQFTEKEQRIVVLEIVKGCIEYAKEKQKTFEEVLHEDVFAQHVDESFSEFICKNIKLLHEQGYIEGTVELEYEIEMDDNTFEETTIDTIDLGNCTFEDIHISLKGKMEMEADSFKEVGKDFLKKSKPIIDCIASTVLQTIVTSAFTVVAKAVGLSI